ncbi:MAG: hypothetical protein V1726_01435 [Methanobacteriota archaeon]
MRKERYFRNNEQAAILDLPMYLIIVMIIAVAVIAAVFFMIPKGTRTMNASVTNGFLISVSPGHSGEYRFPTSRTVWIRVTTNDEKADPISGALVVLTGGNTSDAGRTLTNGSVSLRIRPTLPANINQVYIQMTVKADGYADFLDGEAILVNREV